MHLLAIPQVCTLLYSFFAQQVPECVAPFIIDRKPPGDVY